MIKRTYYNGFKFKYYPIEERTLINYYQNLKLLTDERGNKE